MTAAALRNGVACGAQQGYENDDGNPELRHGGLAIRRVILEKRSVE
jgi:hypothetical protein